MAKKTYNYKNRNIQPNIEKLGVCVCGSAIEITFPELSQSKNNCLF